MDGPAVTVNGKASFGGARIGDGNSVGFDFTQGISQVIDNVSLDPRQARAQGRHRRAVDWRRARSRRPVPLHVRHHQRLPRGEKRDQPPRIRELPAAAR